MKKLFTKMLFFVIVCTGLQGQSVASPRIHSKQIIGLIVTTAGIAYGVIKLDRWWKSHWKTDYEQLYNLVLPLSKGKPVDEKSARAIFESIAIQQHIQKGYMPWIKINHLKGFLRYCESKRRSVIECREKRDNAIKVVDITSTYLGYLEKPWLTRKDIIFAACGFAIGLTYGISVNFIEKKSIIT